jgi:hypothetical protein
MGTSVLPALEVDNRIGHEFGTRFERGPTMVVKYSVTRAEPAVAKDAAGKETTASLFDITSCAMLMSGRALFQHKADVEPVLGVVTVIPFTLDVRPADAYRLAPV